MNQTEPDSDLHANESAEEIHAPESISARIANTGKGFLMGICDAVPGVSGGTVALITGIYDRLFSAIASFDGKLFGLLKRRDWRGAFRHCDAWFLITLVVGIVIGYGAMSKAIKVLMASETLRPFTLAAFAGMIIGSIVVVSVMVRRSKVSSWTGCGFALLIGLGISATIAMQNHGNSAEEPQLIYLFLCAIIAICAMLLPGISGAMLLLIFGVYYSVLEIPSELLSLHDIGGNLTKLSVFVLGCLVGLFSFSRLIHWLLRTHRAMTLSAMLGLMGGSLIVLWPFQNRIEAANEHHKPTYELTLPNEFSTSHILVMGAVVLFAAGVIVIDRLANPSRNPD